MKNLQIIETPDKTKTCPPSIPASMADFSPIMLSTCSTYRVSSGGGPPPLMGHFLTLLNATPLRFSSNHICFDIIHCAGNTGSCIESLCYICPHFHLFLVCHRAWMLRLEKRLVFCEPRHKQTQLSLKKKSLVCLILAHSPSIMVSA